MSKRVTGAALATAAAMLFSTAAVQTASADEAKVHCEGVNSCKGTSACKTATNEWRAKGVLVVSVLRGGCSIKDRGDTDR